MERQTLLRQLDLLRLKFKPAIIPDNIENERTPIVRMVAAGRFLSRKEGSRVLPVERNLLQIKRARNVAMWPGGGDNASSPPSVPTSLVWPPSSSWSSSRSPASAGWTWVAL